MHLSLIIQQPALPRAPARMCGTCWARKSPQFNFFRPS